jgi:pseudaminic acid synthase
MENNMFNQKTFIVAEISANHGHNIQIVKDSIRKAHEIGCDAVKIQTYRPDTITLDCDNEYFQIDTGTIWDGTTLYKLYEDAYTPWEWHKDLFDYAKEIGITLFSTPFDYTAVDLLESCGNPIYKIASFEITDIPLIEYAASKGKPMLISTGIATKDEVADAIEACKSVGNQQICLLKCTSAYPAKLEDANLMTMLDMKDSFNVMVGVSDHTVDDSVSLASVALGGRVVEKHFILDRDIGGPDASFSLTPDEFKGLIEAIRKIEKTIGIVKYHDAGNLEGSRKYARSLFVVEDVKVGDRITNQNVRSIRPGYGLSPKHFKEIIGKKFIETVKRGTPLNNKQFK